MVVSRKKQPVQQPEVAGNFTLAGVPGVPLEGDGGKALQGFFSQLRRLETRADSDERVRIMQIGDSHTAGDYFSQGLRVAFQQRFADGGPGWLRPAGLKNYRSALVVYQNTPSWQVFDSRVDRQSLFSLGGFLAVTRVAGQSLQYRFIHAESPQPSVVQLTWQGGVDAGRVNVVADGAVVNQIQTGGAPDGWMHFEIPLRITPQRLELQTLDNKPVRLAGISLEYRRRGVVLDNIGTNGAQLSILSHWDGGELRHQLARRNPSLVILAYGTNEAFDPDFSAEKLRAALQDAAAVLRASVPQAAVLLLGPPDSMRSRQCGGDVQRNLALIRSVQRQWAAANRWLYWDWSRVMGGRCGIARWAEQQLARTDYVHMTAQGYSLSAGALFAALMRKYQQFIAGDAKPGHLAAKMR